MTIEYKCIWTDGELEFESDLDLKEYFKENPPSENKDFSYLKKIIVKI